MNRGDVRIGDTVLVPGWLFDEEADGEMKAATIERFVSRWRGEPNVVEVERGGVRKRVNVAWLEEKP